MGTVLRFVAETTSEALRAARANLLRTSLAAVATCAAVSTIVVVVTGLDGVAASARETGARTVGSDTFVIAQVVPGQLSRRELEVRLARNPTMTAGDARFLDRFAGRDVVYAPTAQRTADIVAGNRKFEGAAINGTTAALAAIRVIDLAEGRFFTAAETVRTLPVAVVGAEIASTLFPASSALGQSVRIRGRRFEIVGVVRPQGTTGGVTLDRYVYVPLGALERAFGPLGSLQIFARAPGGVAGTAAAESRAHVSLRARRQLRPGEPDTFDILTPEAGRTFVLTLTSRIGAAALPISLMALVTAVVVVANTVLVSVTQRLREIGVRRAVGATRARIAGEVLAESVLTSCFGGAAGVAAAAAVLAAASRISGLPLEPAWQTVAAGLAAAVGTGVLAGYFPARQAAKVDVIATLRLE